MYPISGKGKGWLGKWGLVNQGGLDGHANEVVSGDGSQLIDLAIDKDDMKHNQLSKRRVCRSETLPNSGVKSWYAMLLALAKESRINSFRV